MTAAHIIIVVRAVAYICAYKISINIDKNRQNGGARRTNGKKDIAEAISRSVLFFSENAHGSKVRRERAV